MVAGLLLALPACEDDLRPVPSGLLQPHPVSRDEIARLVDLLASPVPPPKADFDSSDDNPKFAMGFVHPQVEAATTKLFELGPSAYPILEQELGNKRYSYSSRDSTWRNHTVGHRILRKVFAEGVATYEGRIAGKGTFIQYVTAFGGLGSWVKQAATSCRPALRRHYLQWFLAQVCKEQSVDVTVCDSAKSDLEKMSSLDPCEE
ncbi:MAG: hypothetical protein OEZ06_32110 [Myxococcales bacterium]|nr:hypothetical protein [Myxococcales bacterium]